MSEQKPQEETDLTVIKVEKFIKRLHDRDIELKPNAQKILVTVNTGRNALGIQFKNSRPLAEMIGEKMYDYQEVVNALDGFESYMKSAHPKTFIIPSPELMKDLDTLSAIRTRQRNAASELFEYIEQAYSNSVIEEIGLGTKLASLEKENLELKEKNANLQKLNDQLIKKQSQVQRYFPDINNSEQGDVT
jgi:hypothetical protein